MSLTSLTTGISDYATRRAIQQLASKLNYDASPTFAGLTISGEALSSTLITQWSTAYSWGDHAGLYDTIGTASGEIDDHESTYDHSLLHSPVTLDALTGITLTGQQLSYTAGYAIPTTAKQAEWDSAYTHKTTEDAINGLVSCDGSGAYTAKVIGTDVQAYDADLTAIAALTPTDGNIIVGDGSTWVAESGTTARTSLGVGTGDSPTFTALTLSSTTTPLYAGPWTGVPSPIDSHTNIYGDLFCGNVGASVARLRMGSNANTGFMQFNRYHTGSANAQLNTAQPSWSFTINGAADSLQWQRSPAGSTTLATLLHLQGSTGRFGIGTTAPGKMLEINASDGSCLRLTYNDSDGSAAYYVDHVVTSTGKGSITPSGGQLNIVGICTIGDGGTTNYTQVASNGDVSFVGTAGFYPRFLTQADEPAAGTGATQCDTGEMVVWKDSDDSKVYLCFNDGGTIKTVELA